MTKPETLAAPAKPARPRPGDSRLARRLAAAVEGEVLFDAVSRGQYATDASIYQIEPLGVVVPRHDDDVAATLAIAAEEGVPVLPRGGGTSQCGQTVAEAVVLDTSKHMNRLLDLDAENRRAVVQPGIVLDQLNRQLKARGLMFPVDVSTASRATIGGMTGNNSCGARSIRYGTMAHNVLGIDGFLPDGTALTFGEVGADLSGLPPRLAELVRGLRDVHARVGEEVKARFPDLLRRVGGYNLDTIDPAGHNLARLLVGSEGTLAFFRRIELALQPIPPHKVLGVCHFPTFYQAMDNTRHLVELGPAAVELVDRTMIDLARDIAAFRPTVDRFVRGEPEALLLVEFAGVDREEQLRKLRQLVELMGDLGFADAVVEAVDPAFQAAIWEVRKAGLNIMMSMKGDGKPVSFIEDCAVRLEDLAEYTDRLTQVFRKHGTTGTWYAHASVGCLHVRPVLNLKDPVEVTKMRAIAEEAFAMVREYKGSHSGEHGDGLVRSEFHEPMYGPVVVDAFREVKRLFDPDGRMNPGKIVDPPRMDDRRLFRYGPDYRAEPPAELLFDWSDWGGFDRAVEMCNNNGACRKAATGVMCPSFRATGDERHLTRGRANTLRLALSGQLGPDALTSDAVWETLELCVACKGCRRECPTGVDMARMKAEVAYQRRKTRKPSLRDRLLGNLPALAPRLSALGPLLNLRDRIPGLPQLSERLLGFAAKRPLPRWHRRPFREATSAAPVGDGRDVVLFVDTFDRWFEPENVRAAVRVLEAAGRRVHLPAPPDSDKRPLCCGRTWLASGDGERAKAELARLARAYEPFVRAGVPVVGLEPSCLLTLRDELSALLPVEQARPLAENALLFTEYLAREHAAGRLDLPLKPLPQRQAVLHGHCHQKAFGALGASEAVLRLIPDLEVQTLDTTCCGMAGSFGYEAEHYDTSVAIGEMDVLPKVRAAAPEALIVADGTSCRCQMRDGAGREASHIAVVLARALEGGEA